MNDGITATVDNTGQGCGRYVLGALAVVCFSVLGRIRLGQDLAGEVPSIKRSPQHSLTDTVSGERVVLLRSGILRNRGR